MSEGNVVLTSKTGLISQPEYHVFFISAKQMEQELQRFLKLETGLDLTVELSCDDDKMNSLYVSIREGEELVSEAGEEMTVLEFLEERHHYPFSYCGGFEAACEMVCRMFELPSNHLALLQYFDDDDGAKVRISVSVSHFSGCLTESANEETIAGTYIGRRAVSNMLYFLLKAAQEEIDLSLTVPRCTHFEDVVYGTILEWAEDIEKKAESGDPAFTAMEELLLEELKEGTYLNEGREAFMHKVEKALAPSEEDPKRLFIYQWIDRISKEAEAIRLTWY